MHRGMKTFIALYRGGTVASAELVAVTAEATEHSVNEGGQKRGRKYHFRRLRARTFGSASMPAVWRRQKSCVRSLRKHERCSPPER